MKVEELAVLVYGVLACLFIAALALMTGAELALVALIGAAFSTYVFQVIQLGWPHLVWPLLTLWGLATALAAAATGLAFLGV